MGETTSNTQNGLWYFFANFALNLFAAFDVNYSHDYVVLVASYIFLASVDIFYMSLINLVGVMCHEVSQCIQPVHVADSDLGVQS